MVEDDDEKPWKETDRGTAVLTNTQREKLLNDELTLRDRQNIRDRIENTMYDFIILNEHLRERDQLQVLYPDAVDWQNKDDGTVLQQLAVKVADGELFRPDLALGIMNVLGFFADTVFYPKASGIGDMTYALGEIDWEEVFEESKRIVEDSNKSSSEEMLFHMSHAINHYLGEISEVEVDDEDFDKILKQLGIDPNANSEDT